jgi:hypothetical protein
MGIAGQVRATENKKKCRGIKNTRDSMARQLKIVFKD